MVDRVVITQQRVPKISSSRELATYSLAQIQSLLAQVQAQSDPGLKFMETFTLLQGLGMDAFSLEMQTRALAHRRVFRLLSPEQPKLRLLAIFGPGNMLDNAPLDHVLFGSDIQLDVLYVTGDEVGLLAVPDHDVAILALSVSSRSLPLLNELAKRQALWPRPWLNHVAGVLRCDRDVLSLLLQDVPGLAMPTTQRVARSDVASVRPPCLIRPIDTHAGDGFCFIADSNDVDAYLSDHPGAHHFVSEYIDYSDADGLFRKNRIAMIDRKPYVCHRAVSDHWMVHYKSAHMELSVSKRQDEQSFMENFQRDFAHRHRHALAAIARRVDLDYFVMDCAQTRDGDLLMFEADNAAWIHATDSASIYPYKRPVMDLAFKAFENLLYQAAQQSIAYALPQRAADG